MKSIRPKGVPARGSHLEQECTEIYNGDAIPAGAFTAGKRAVL